MWGVAVHLERMCEIPLQRLSGGPSARKRIYVPGGSAWMDDGLCVVRDFAYGMAVAA
jgi:hypothetical protein